MYCTRFRGRPTGTSSRYDYSTSKLFLSFTPTRQSSDSFVAAPRAARAHHTNTSNGFFRTRQHAYNASSLTRSTDVHAEAEVLADLTLTPFDDPLLSENLHEVRPPTHTRHPDRSSASKIKPGRRTCSVSVELAVAGLSRRPRS